ncbi:hemolysin-coregulated protein, partial [Salmonella enterica subsp. enterica serovar Newport str. SHSN005]
MAYDIFLKIDGIDGESMDDKHKNEIEVLSWKKKKKHKQKKKKKKKTW